MTSIDTSDVATLRRLNAQTTLDRLREEPQRWFTVRELSDLTELSRPTVSRVLEDLEKAGWSTSQAGVPGATGRPARRYRFNGEAGLVVAVDTGMYNFNTVITDLAGTQLAEHVYTATSLETIEELVAAIRRSVTVAMEMTTLDAPVRAVAVSMPGPVDDEGVLRVSKHARGWVGWNVRPAVQELFPDAEIVMGQDIDFATYGEIVSGALQGVDSAVHVIFSDSCHTNLVVNGDVVRGAHGLAGARPQPHGTTHEEARDWITLRDDLYANHPRKRMSEIIAAAQRGEQADVDLLSAYARGLAPRVAFLMRALAPELLLVGGQMMDLPEIALPPLRAAVLEAAGLDGLAEHEQPVPEIRMAHHRDHVSAPIGGIHAALAAIRWEA